MENEVPHIYYQESKMGSDSSFLGHWGNVMREILFRHRILPEKVKKVKKQIWKVRAKMS